MPILRLPELVDLNTYINAERRNRFVGAKIKREMTELVALECMAQRIPPWQLRKTPLKRMVFLWKHKNRRKDPDNLEFGKKFILDGMVQAGVLGGDGWEQLGKVETVHRHVIAKDPGVEVIFG